MADPVDQAQARSEHLLDGLLAKRTRFQGVSQTHCLECDTPLPERRRELLPGVELCVECQQLEEEMNRDSMG